VVFFITKRLLQGNSMSRLTVESIMQAIAATVNQESAAPSSGSSEWSLWLQYINRSYSEWVQANDWESLRKTYFPSITGSSMASVPLPLDFRKLAASPILYGGTTSGEEVPEVLLEQRRQFNETDKFFSTIGNHSDGFTLLFHPATLASGASLEVQYYSTPTSLASPLEVPITSDPQYLIDRSIAYILEARSDPRFQLEENKARDRLMAMIENVNAAKYNSYAGSAPVLTTLRKSGFRLGRN